MDAFEEIVARYLEGWENDLVIMTAKLIVKQ
jgi:hypothetical protein